MLGRELIIKDTHRALLYRNGALSRILEAGRHNIPRRLNLGVWRSPKYEVVLVDVRERDLTIKGQEILTADKVAIRVTIVVRFRVTDPRAAIHAVESYLDRLYTDVQLAARRSLASMPLEIILTNRNRLSEDILQEIAATAATYGVTIIRSDVKDLIFPGNLQEIMNRVLAAERNSQAQIDRGTNQSRYGANRGPGESRNAEARGRGSGGCEARGCGSRGAGASCPTPRRSRRFGASSVDREALRQQPDAPSPSRN